MVDEAITDTGKIMQINSIDFDYTVLEFTVSVNNF